MVCHCLVIESKDGLVLVDTVIGANAVRDPKRWLHGGFNLIAGAKLDPEEPAIRQIEKLGFAQRDVRHIVVTHLDLDHAGGLADFPDAEVHCFLPEHDAAMARATGKEKQRYRPNHWAHQPRWKLHHVDAGEQWHGFSSVRALGGSDDEILIVPMTGHTRGHAAIAVKQADGNKWLLHCGDAYFYHGEMDADPTCPLALRAFQSLMAVDNTERLSNQAKLRRLALESQGDVELFCAHDPTELQRY